MKFNARWRVAAALLMVGVLGAVLVPVNRRFHEKQRHFRNQALRAAVKKGDSAAVLKALQSGADPDTPIRAGIVAWSIKKGRADTISVLQYVFARGIRHDASAEQIVLHLLDFGAKPSLSFGEGPLRATWDYPRVLKKLIQRGVPVRGDDGNRALLIAAYMRPDAMRVLVEGGANINATDAQGATPLGSAILSCRPQSVQFVLRHGADPCQKADANISADIASYRTAPDKVRRLPLEIALRALDRQRALSRKLARDPRAYQLQSGEVGRFRPIDGVREFQADMVRICQILRAAMKHRGCGSAT